MDLIHQKAAGIDISKRDAKVAIRAPGKRAGTFTTKVTSRGATTNQILTLREMPVAEQVTTVVMEATSDYGKPFYYLFEDVLPVMLVNAKAARNIPGRKTDVSDAAWLAQLAAHGLLRASFVPPEPIPELRDLTRARTTAVRDRTREIQRLEKFLESSGINLSATVTNLMGVSSRSMLEALIEGERDPQKLAVLAGDEGFEHRTGGDAGDIGGDRGQFDPRVLQHLLQPLGLAGPFVRDSGPARVRSRTWRMFSGGTRHPRRSAARRQAGVVPR